MEKKYLDSLLARALLVHSGHPELVGDPLFQVGNLLVLNVGVGNEDVRQTLLEVAVAHPVTLQLTINVLRPVRFKI